MYFLVYASAAVEPFSTEQLAELMTRSQANNTRQGITGMLLYKDGNFLQVLEGEPEAVQATHARIARDPRHRQLMTLLKGSAEERQFPDWSMGFRDLNSPEVHALPGYSEFLNTPLTGAEFAGDPTRCQKLLLTFKRTM